MQKRQPEKKQITNNLTFCQNGATLCKDLTPRPYGITGKRSSRRTSGMSQIILRNRSKQPCQPNLTGKSVVKTQLGFTDSPSSDHLAWYWNALRWSRRPGVGTTWLELAIDFWMCTGDLPGRNTDTNPKKEVAPTAAARKFSAMSRRLRQMKAPLGNCDTAAGIVSLVPLGFSTMYGFVGRPLLRRAEYVQKVFINMVGQTSMLTLKKVVRELTLQVTRMPLPLWQPITMAAGHHRAPMLYRLFHRQLRKISQ